MEGIFNGYGRKNSDPAGEAGQYLRGGAGEKVGHQPAKFEQKVLTRQFIGEGPAENSRSDGLPL